MMVSPRLIISGEKFKHNVQAAKALCSRHNISLMGVSKVFCADPLLVSLMLDGGIDFLADSRIDNLRGVSCPVPKVLLRLPMLSEISEVLRHCDISLNSELAVIKALDKASQALGITHGVIIMVDLGDLREGIFDEEELFDTVLQSIGLANIRVEGIGVNLTCYGGIIPSAAILNKLEDLKTRLEKSLDFELKIVSGGNSSSLPLLLKGELPRAINNLRLGEALVLGRETAYGGPLEGFYSDVFTLEAEIIELKKKPSMPLGEVGVDAFGKKPEFIDRGIIPRAILAIGKQDVDYRELTPHDGDICLMGSSSDHILIDLSRASRRYSLGDTVKFKLTYGAILSLMTSPYVKKFISSP